MTKELATEPLAWRAGRRGIPRPMRIHVHWIGWWWGLLLLGAAPGGFSAAWAPAKGPLMTRWSKEVSPQHVLPEYPRPQMARREWVNLNGLWDYAIVSTNGGRPPAWDGKLLVPFPVEWSGQLSLLGRKENSLSGQDS